MLINYKALGELQMKGVIEVVLQRSALNLALCPHPATHTGQLFSPVVAFPLLSCL